MKRFLTRAGGLVFQREREKESERHRKFRKWWRQGERERMSVAKLWKGSTIAGSEREREREREREK